MIADKVSDRPPTTTFAVLGLLSWGPRSPYGLWQIAEQSLAHFWTISKSQVYGEVARLEELGYVEGEEVAQDGLPDKTVFRITEAGESALDVWLADPSHEPDRFRSGFLVKVFFGHRVPHQTLLQMVQTYEEETRRGVEALRTVLDMDLPPGFEYARLTAQLGKRVGEAALGWAVDTLKELEGAKERTP